MSVALKKKPALIDCRGCGSKGPFVERFRTRNRYDDQAPLSIATCPDCGICFINPQYGVDTYLDFYSNDYFTDLNGQSLQDLIQVAKGKYRTALFQPFKSFVEKLPPGGRYLDAGAGTGIFLDFLFEANPGIAIGQVSVLEPSRAAGEDIKARFPGIDVHQAIVETNAYPDHEFDLVLCSALIEHFVDPFESLLNLNRVLKVVGRILLVTPKLDEHSLLKGPDGFFKFVHTFYYTRASLESLLKKAGFEIESLEEKRQKGINDIFWYTGMIVCAKKVADRSAADLERLRTTAEDDADNVREAEKLFRVLQAQAKAYRIKSRIKRILKKPFKFLLGR